MTSSTLLWILVLQFLFGLNYLVSKTIVLYYNPLFWATLRACFTSVVIMTFLIIKKEVKWRDVFLHKKQLLALALTGIILNQGCFLLGLKFTTSYNSALINTLIPVFTLCIAALKGHESITKQQILGSIVALVGVWVLTPLNKFTFSNQNLIGDLLTVGNVIAYSSYLVSNREFVKSHSPLWTTGWVFTLGSLGLLGLTLPQFPSLFMALPPREVQKALVYGLVGGTLIPYIILSYVLRKTKSSHVALFVYLQPAIVGITGILFYDYHFTRESITATFLIFFGVFLGTRKPATTSPLPQ